MPRHFLAWHCLHDLLACRGRGSAQLMLAGRLQEKKASRSKKPWELPSPGNRLQWTGGWGK